MHRSIHRRSLNKSLTQLLSRLWSRLLAHILIDLFGAGYKLALFTCLYAYLPLETLLYTAREEVSA